MTGDKMASSESLVLVMNQPSPYRWHFFEILSDVGKKNGVEVRVVCLFEGSKRRDWLSGQLEGDFELIMPPTVRVPRSEHWVFNPTLFHRLKAMKPRWLVVGGYDTITTLSMSLFKAKLPAEEVYLWAEGNSETDDRRGRMVEAVKKRSIRGFDGYLVPGLRGRQWLRNWTGREDLRVHVLRNTVDEKKFRAPNGQTTSPSTIRHRCGVGEDTVLAFTPARLNAEKGLDQFLEIISPYADGDWKWLIAGRGPEEAELKRFIGELDLKEKVKLLGAVPYNEMPNLYHAADLFILPSLRDPNPLSVIEAAFAGLPLLVSRFAGNAPEYCEGQRGGVMFDPFMVGSARRKFAALVEKDREGLHELGERTRMVAEREFRSRDVAKGLIRFLRSSS